NTHAYIMCDEETRDILKPLCIDAGFTAQKTLIWFKKKRGMGYNYPASCERILFLKKGKRRLNMNMNLDVLCFPAVRGGYPTEKPSGLLDVLVMESSDPGGIVLDPFFGSGSTALSALKFHRRFIGSDP